MSATTTIPIAPDARGAHSLHRFVGAPARWVTYFRLKRQWHIRQREKLWAACLATGHCASGPNPLAAAVYDTVRYVLTGSAWSKSQRPNGKVSSGDKPR